MLFENGPVLTVNDVRKMFLNLPEVSKEEWGDWVFIDLKTLVGKRYKNSRNGKIYQILNIIWSGDTDEWVVYYHNTSTGAEFVRSIKGFFGSNRDNKPRFVLIEEVPFSFIARSYDC